MCHFVRNTPSVRCVAVLTLGIIIPGHFLNVQCTPHMTTYASLQWFDSNLHRRATAHLLQRLLVLVDRKDVRDHALDVYFPAVEVRHGARKAVNLRKGADDLGDLYCWLDNQCNGEGEETYIDFVCEYLLRAPAYAVVVGVDTVNQESAASSNEGKCVLGESGYTGCFNLPMR